MSRAKSGVRIADKNLVVGAIDDNMVYPVLVWAFSLHAAASTPPHIVIGFLEGHLSERNRKVVGKVLTYLGIGHEFLELASDSRFITQGHISPTTFTKFLLADQIAELNVWIDVDTVATEGWDSIFDSIAQSQEEVKLVVAERGNRGSGSSKKLQKPSDLVFNAGVLGWPARPRLPWSEQLDSVEMTETQEQFLFNSLYASHIAKVPETYNTLTYRRDHFRDTAPPFILHYAGAHKPWHMPRRFSPVCTSYRCPWSLWFDAEEDMLDAVARSPHVNEVEELKNHALTSGAIGKSRDYSGRKLLRTLQRMGIMGWVLVFAAKPFSRWIPRGTHPLH
jgi:lipopolysaccharide biosynthesis glycosyltransferase